MEKNVKIVLAISVVVIVIAGVALYGIQSNKAAAGPTIPNNPTPQRPDWARWADVQTGIDKKITEASERINGPSPKMPSVDIPIILEGLIIVGILGVGWCGYRATKKVQEHP